MTTNAGIGSPEKPSSEAGSEPSKKTTEVDLTSSKTMVVIILVGVALAFFAGSRSVKGDPNPSSEGSPIIYYGLVILPWVFLALAILFITRWMAKASTIQLFNRAVLLLNAGYLDQAEEELEKAAGSGNRKELLNGLIEFHRAQLNLCRGRLHEATASFDRITKQPWFVTLEDGAHDSLIFSLVLAYLLTGDTAKAEAAMNLKKGGILLIDNHLLKAQFMLLVRKGAYAEALTLARKNWREIESMTTPYYSRLFRLMWAFALSRAEPASPLQADLTAGARPFWKGQYEPLFSEWPEVQAFLREQRLTDEHASVSIAEV